MKLRLGRKEEDEVTRLSEITGRNIEIEDRREVRGHLSSSRSTICFVGIRFGYRNDKMRKLEFVWQHLALFRRRRRTWRIAVRSLERDLDTACLAEVRLGVNILTVISRLTSEESRDALVIESAIAANGEARSWRSTSVTLELSGRWRQDATSALSIVDDPVCTDGVRACCEILRANSVLSVGELRKDSRNATRGRQREIAASISRY